ncbi:uncharacterized protein LOC126293192 [Schistocerca gregaria]|uniref:uncharacterized protein LOC126293192 n=1 Tax=Schistocerca gregaria TaxID=7010 RepID=UPI00211EE03E|nr:uncharacterized protein LOC126293192 [Schistocerca gregaria]
MEIGLRRGRGLLGRPTTSKTDENIDHVCILLNTDHWSSVSMIADDLTLDKMTVHTTIIKELSLRKICGKMVPKILSDIQKRACGDTWQDYLRRFEADTEFLGNVITRDKTWVFQHDRGTKRRTSASLRPRKARVSKSKLKAVLIVFFNVTGRSSSAFYCEVLERMKDRVIE